MKNRSLLMTIVALMITMSSLAQTTGTFTDPQGGQTYKTITIENPLKGTSDTWMAQNLNYKVNDSWAYDNEQSSLVNYGYLYTWETAKVACPAGWHLPSDAEWSVLVNAFGGYDSAGNALKSTKGWNKNGNGTNSSGFTALPGGYRKVSGIFSNIGNFGYWWSSTVDSTNRANLRNLNYMGTNVNWFNINDSNALSVRCIRGN